MGFCRWESIEHKLFFFVFVVSPDEQKNAKKTAVHRKGPTRHETPFFFNWLFGARTIGDESAVCVVLLHAVGCVALYDIGIDATRLL